MAFIAGARLDKHSEIENPIISPRLTAKYDMGHGFTSRAAFSSGFKAPQTFDEDLHLCGLAGDQRVIRNIDGLEAEHSVSFSGGVEYQTNNGGIPMIAAVSLFHTELGDVFTEEYVGVVDDLEVWQRVNSEGAHVTGFEVDFGIRPDRWLEFRTGFTFKQSEYDTPLEDFNTTNFLRTPDIYGHLRLSYDVTLKINFFMAGRYTGEADIPHEVLLAGEEEPELILEKSEEFVEFDLGLSYRIPINNKVNSFTKFNLGVKNILDTYQEDLDWGAERDPAYVYGPSQPRTVYAGFELSF